MPLNRFDKIKDELIKQFEQEFPGEKINDSPFAVYVVHRYCDLVDRHNSYRELVRLGKEW